MVFLLCSMLMGVLLGIFSVMLLLLVFCRVDRVCISEDLLVLLGLSSLNMLWGIFRVIVLSVCMLLV